MTTHRPRTALLRRHATVTAEGGLDQSVLDQLGTNLSLTMTGAIDDPAGTELGYREIPSANGPYFLNSRIALVRSGPRTLTFTLDTVPSRTTITKWQCLIETGARAAGLTVTDTTQTPLPPGADPDPDEIDRIAAIDAELRQRFDELVSGVTPASLDEARREPGPDPSLYKIGPDPSWHNMHEVHTEDAVSEETPAPTWQPPALPDPNDNHADPSELGADHAVIERLKGPPFNPPQPPSDPSAMDDPELVEFVRWVRNLAWAWNIHDVLSLLTAAGSTDIVEWSSQRITFNSRYNVAPSYINLVDDKVTDIDLPVAHFPTYDDDSTARVGQAYVRMVRAMTNSYRVPSATADDGSRSTWTGIENTVSLIRTPDSVRAVFQLNDGVTMICGEDDPMGRRQMADHRHPTHE
ncbi:hypothetical protein NOVA_27255 [Nocardia nova]|uniref:DUF6301 family protein n=1 Tax=Nocardia nova TaxID=37330 RepID=UPI001C494336|nr:DUF6301 family protein [Nocardia nova]MBV7706489.1 hypothetical protein [Nocardia nova]